MKALPLGLLLCMNMVVSAQTIDTEKSTVNFEIGNMWVNTVEGTFSNMTGSVSYSLKNPSLSSFAVCVDANTVNTGNTKRDEHLKTDDFFAVATYPQICIVSTKISSSPEGLIFTGTLTMHGVTKVITFPFTYVDQVFTGTFRINRFDYKIGEDVSTFTVDDDVEITIQCVLK